jgi:hypothetical protein
MYETYVRNGNLIDREMEVKHWTHPANFVKIIEGQEDSKHTTEVFRWFIHVVCEISFTTHLLVIAYYVHMYCVTL